MATAYPPYCIEQEHIDPVCAGIEEHQQPAGLSVRAIISHGDGDPQWAAQAATQMRELETRYNQPRQLEPGQGK